MLKLDIPTSRDKIFEQYLKLINPLLHKSRLTDNELKVLSKILYIYHIYLYLGKDNANNIVFHTETKKRIREALGKETNRIVSSANFDNSISSLKKKGFITGSEVLHNVPIKDGNINIEFNLIIKEDNGSISEEQ